MVQQRSFFEAKLTRVLGKNIGISLDKFLVFMDAQNQNKRFQKDNLFNIQHAIQNAHKLASSITSINFQIKIQLCDNIDQKRQKIIDYKANLIFKSNTKSQQNYRQHQSLSSYKQSKNMINGIKPSEMDTRNRSLHIHYNKLSQITSGHCSFISTFNKNFNAIVRRKKYNHIKWKHFKFNESQDKLWKQNEIVKDKIVRILSSKPKLQVSSTESLRDFSKSNYFYQKKRFQTTIDRENPEIAKRILKASGPLNHKKDTQDYKKTRQVVRRLERFPMLKRLEQSVESSRMRFKTQDQFHRRNYSVTSKSIDPTLRLKTYV